MSKRFISIVTALAVLSTFSFTGCGSKSSTDKGSTAAATTGANAAQGKPVTLSFWAAAITPERDTFLKDMAAKFHEKNPNVTIDFLGVPGDLQAYRQKLDMAIAANQAPDITNDFRADLITRGYYAPLDDYFDKWSDKDKINPAAVKTDRDLDQKAGKLYAMPYSSQPWVFWIRPDWFKEANLPIPETWDQMFDSIKKLTDKSKGRYGLSIRGGSGSANTLETLMYSYSGIQEYFTKDGKSTINDPLNVEFVEKYLGMYNVYTPEDDLSKGWTELAATFQSGKAAIVFHNLGSASAQEKAFNGDRSKFMAIPNPKGVKGYVQHAGLNPLGVSIANTTKDKDAAWSFLTFYVSKDINSAYGKLYGEIPANSDTKDDAWIKDIPYFKTGADLLNSKDTHFGENPYYLPGYMNIQSKIAEPMIQKVMTKQMTAKEMLDTWAKALEKEKADFDAANKK